MPVSSGSAYMGERGPEEIGMGVVRKKLLVPRNSMGPEERSRGMINKDMRFSEYVQSVRNLVESGASDAVDPGKWTCRKVGEEYWCWWGGHGLNLAELRSRLEDLYASRGHGGEGFSKLDEEGLGKYAAARGLLKLFLGSTVTAVADAGHCAEWIYDREAWNG